MLQLNLQFSDFKNAIKKAGGRKDYVTSKI